MSFHTLFILPTLFQLTLAIQEERMPLSASTPEFWGYLTVVIILVVLSGLLAGLTLGLMTLDEINLYILSVAGTSKEKVYASHILPIRKNGHLLLTCLVLTNTVINETLPIILDGMFGKGYIAVVISTVLIVLFSEIIPQAICSKHGLALGSIFYIPIKILIGFWFIIAWPISKVLGWAIGSNHGTIYTPQGLSELINIHSVNGDYGGTLDRNTIKLISRSLEYQIETAGQKANYQPTLLIPISKVLDTEMMADIMKTGFSHVFVYRDIDNSNRLEMEQILGMLACYKESIPVSTIPIDSILTTSNCNQSIMDIFTLLVKSSSKFCLLMSQVDNNESTVVEMTEKTFLEKETLPETQRFTFGEVASIKQVSLDGLLSELVN
ncbi:DUF21-domain-containing protein [Backusella circina FSU 941]|nr:DUF21-domain-containing protein [Backusella circina FSU 941]